MKKQTMLMIVVIIVILASMLAVASPALAAGDPAAPHTPYPYSAPHQEDPNWAAPHKANPNWLLPRRAALTTRESGCAVAWKQIDGVKYKDVGYRFFEKHSWCKTWLMNKYGIDYDFYRLMNP